MIKSILKLVDRMFYTYEVRTVYVVNTYRVDSSRGPSSIELGFDELTEYSGEELAALLKGNALPVPGTSLYGRV